MNKQELNTLMAEEVMGWKHIGCKWYDKDNILQYNDNSQELNWHEVWHPTEDMNQTMMCAEKIKSKSLEKGFVEALIELLDLDVMLFCSALEGSGYRGNVPEAIFALITASPKTICECIAEAIGGKGWNKVARPVMKQHKALMEKIK